MMLPSHIESEEARAEAEAKKAKRVILPVPVRALNVDNVRWALLSAIN